MNQYHIYEAIGRGKYSTVYKGRKKKTIEYFAIKSVDKSHKNKVLQEVRVLYPLDHPNVLKFYSWYETSAHLWLVLEYCVGGDLLTLLQQDSKLPEDSIHEFARDLVTALQYLHTKGIIYCDLKPSNILLDENGHTKLCDFGLARKLIDISKTSSSELPQSKRGTPCYMAPELFQEGGVHSYASDFWALGCVLYECYAGKPPFVGKEFTQLVKSILSDSIPPLPGNPSLPFLNLINSLLIKDPSKRIQWSELCTHPFFNTKISYPIDLLSQPAFDKMIELSSKLYLTEKSVQTKTPKRDPKKIQKQDENSNLGSRNHETPLSSGRKIQTKGLSSNSDKQKDTRGVNLMRLSRIAKTNLKRENEKENYRRPMPNSSENDAEVQIENNDMELDFNENTENNEEDTDEPENLISTPEREVEDNDNITSNSDATPVHELSSEHVEVGPTPTSVKATREVSVTEHEPGHETESDSSDLSHVFWHTSDLSVRPVMPSRKSDKGSESLPSLPFEAISAVDFAKMSNEQLNFITNKIVSIITGNNAIPEKQSVIKYLETVSINADVANILTNGQIMLVLVKLLKQSKASALRAALQSKTSALRAQLSSLIGLLIRHSTFINDDLVNSGILNALTDGLRDSQEKVRRFSMAALGELLFYISTQNEQATWQVPGSVFSLVTSVLRHGEDDITQLYAVRTIENMSSQGGQWANRFTSHDVITNLCYIFKAHTKQESIRLTAGSCLVRLVRFNPTSIQRVIEKVSLKDISSSLIKGNPREQQICLNLLNMVMLETNTKHVQLVEDKNFVLTLLSIIEQGSEILRGKALVLVGLLCKNGRKWLAQFFCNARFLSGVDRVVKEKDIYVQKCYNAFTHTVCLSVPALLETISIDIQQLMSGKRRVLINRGVSKNNIHLFPVILHLLGSSSFKHKVVTHQVVQQLGNLLKLAETPFQGRDEFQITLLRVFETIGEDPNVINESPNVFINQILPSLAILYKGNKDGDARFLCLKILFDVMVHFLNEGSENEKQKELKELANESFLPLYPLFIEDDDPIPVYAQKLLVMLIDFKYIKIENILDMKTVSQCFGFLLGDFSTANVNNVMLCLALASASELDTKVLSQLKIVRKIGNLLEFVRASEMEDFIEPTLGLCKAFLLRSVGLTNYFKEPDLLYENSIVNQQEYIKDIADFGNNVGVLLELVIYNEEVEFSDLASECLILLFKSAPREGTSGFLMNLGKVRCILECKSLSELVVKRVLHGLGYACRYYLANTMILSISISELLKIEGIVSEFKDSSVLGEAASCVALELQRLPRRI